MTNWIVQQHDLLKLAGKQLFFVGGAPRSGTTWLQHMLDCHPDVSCRGEGLFGTLFATPIAEMMEKRATELTAKNNQLFRHTGGYPLPEGDQIEHLLGTAILLAMQKQCEGMDYQAIGEKTPENVFLFSRFKDLFPNAKFIGIARDPRDVLTSAWHMFHPMRPGEDEAAAKRRFIEIAMPSIAQGTREMLALAERYPADAMIVTYRNLIDDQATKLAELFRFLCVSDQGDIVDDCVRRSSFEAMSGGRRPGEGQNGAFLRKGIVGDWRSTLTQEMNTMILKELGWMFPLFGWEI